jgi:flagellar biosynthetic protein FliQ
MNGAATLFQALTQLQEQTLIYVPKILVVFGSMLFLLPFMGDALAGYMIRIAARIAAGG